MPKILVATHHDAEFAELAAHLASLGWEAISPGQTDAAGLPYDQGGLSHRDQAVRRAGAFAAVAGMPALALAPALEVYALDKAPGHRTHAYAGTGASDAEHRAKLLSAMKRVPVGQRIALFQATAAVVVPGVEKPWVTTSTLECEVTAEERGQGGFLFDPLTQLQSRKTLAEMDDDERWRMGHRGMAMKQMEKKLLEIQARLT